VILDKKRNKSIAIYVNVEELNRVRELLSQTACRNMSEYGRKLLLRKPVLVLHRNHSLDKQMHEMIRLRKSLQEVKQAFDQLRMQSTWYRARMPSSSLLYLLLEERVLGEQLQHIKKYFHKMNEQWWQSSTRQNP
jgi:hypothetical protein